MEQAELIAQFNEKYRDKFNPYFFERNEDAIIDQIMKVIMQVTENIILIYLKSIFQNMSNYQIVLLAKL